MSIAHQPAMPKADAGLRGPRPYRLVAAPRPGRAFAKMAGLIVLTSAGAAIAVGVTALALLVFISNLAG